MIDYASMAVGDEAEMPRRCLNPNEWEGLNQAEYAACQAYCRAHVADSPSPQFEVCKHQFASGIPYGYTLRRTR